MSIAEHLSADLERHRAKRPRPHPHETREHHRVEVEKLDDGTFSIKGHKKHEAGEAVEAGSAPTTMSAKNHHEMVRHVKHLMCPDAAGTMKDEEKD